MFDLVSKEDLTALLEVAAPYCVSFYVPTHSKGSGVATDPIRLKNLITTAKDELEQLGVRTPDVAGLLSPVESLLDDPAFWARSAQGLAVFATADGVRQFRLPGPVREAVMVSDRLWIAPLMPFLDTGDVFFILTLSEKQVQLMRGSRYEVTELGLGEIPASSAEVLRFDDREAQLQSHGADRVGAGQVSATFHGQGGADAFEEADQARFLHAVDHGLAGVVGNRSAPLVLAGVEHIVAGFRHLSGHGNIAESFISGNPERFSPAELHERALPLVEADLDADRLRATETLRSSSKPTVETIHEALNAASTGRVSALFFPRDEHTWGSYDAESQTVDEHADRSPGDYDLIDLAVRETLGHGGSVFAVEAHEIPVDAPIAAMLRY